MSASNVAKSRNQAATRCTDEIMARYPGVPAHQLARMLVRDHPLVFTSFDAARNAIRYRRGASGKRNRVVVGLPAPSFS